MSNPVKLHAANINDEIIDKIELPKDFRQDWLNALRSDDFYQTEGTLTNGKGGYCCLGVACKAAGYADYFLRCVSTRTGTAKSINGDLLSYMGYIGKEESGFDLKKVPDVLHGDSNFPDKLSDFNDNGYTFNDIADFIERNTVGV